MQLENKTNIPFLEIPNAEEIEKHINDSSLILCLCISEKESASLLAPYSYYLCANRYMFLSNIVPKCLDFFKTVILPLHGNRHGIYFEIDRNQKKKGKYFNANASPDTDSKIENGRYLRQEKEKERRNDTCEDRNKKKNYKDDECERIVLDWRLPIGVLFDIYCEFEEDEEENIEEEKKEREIKTETEEDKKKNYVVYCKNGETVEDCCNIVECAKDELKLRRKDEISTELKETKSLENIKPIFEFENKEKEYMKNTRRENHNAQYYRLVRKDHMTDLWYQKKFIKMSQKNIPWKLRVCFKNVREYCHWDFLHNNKNNNYVEKINLLPYNSCIPLYKGIHNFEEFIMNQLLKASQIYRKNSRTIQKLPYETEKEMLFHLQNFNIKNICALYKRHIYDDLLQSFDFYNYILKEKLRSRSNSKQMNSNICSAIDVTHERNVECRNFIDNTIKKQNLDIIKESIKDLSTISKESENHYGNSNVCDAKGTEERKCNSAYNELIKENKKHRLCDLLKNENVIEELPIIIHIYGPPYNQVVTKFPPFKIKMAENDVNIIEEFYVYTLGDFLHEQFPEFFRKITKKNNKIDQIQVGCHGRSQNRNKSIQNVDADYNKNDKNNDKSDDLNNVEIENDSVIKKREELSSCSKDVSVVDMKSGDKIQMETIHYFQDNNFLIFFEYIFVIINGVQIPLNTPLYWLSIMFSQFDSFLHIILRIPPY